MPNEDFLNKVEPQILLPSPGTVMPALSIDAFKQRQNSVVEFARLLHFGEDYNTLDRKPPEKDEKGNYKNRLILLKSGAEKAYKFFGLVGHTELVEKIEDFFGTEAHNNQPFFYYRFITKVLDLKGNLIAIGTGSINSLESKYGFRWVDLSELNNVIPPGYKTRKSSIKEPDFAVRKKETAGPYGKPVEHWNIFQKALDDGSARLVEKESQQGKLIKWVVVDAVQVRIPNENVSEVVNTLLKMGKKRSEVDGIITAAGLSGLFTQDLDEMEVGETWNPFSPNLTPQQISSEKVEIAGAPQAAPQGTIDLQKPARPPLVEPQPIVAGRPPQGEAQATLGPGPAPGPQPSVTTPVVSQKENETEVNDEVDLRSKIKIEDSHIEELKNLCKTNRIKPIEVGNWAKKTFGHKVSECTLTEFDEVKKYIVEGSMALEKIKKLKVAIAVHKDKDLDEEYNKFLDDYVETNFNKQFKHLNNSEIIQLQTAMGM
jgi:hypothetical protein